MSRRMRRAVAVLAAGLLTVSAVVVESAPAHAAAIIHVVATNPTDADGCGEATYACKTIQYAVDHAQPGDTVEVDEGSQPATTYTENVRITKAITVTAGAGDVTITGALTVADSGATGTTVLTGLHFADTGAVVVDGATQPVSITDNTFDDVTGSAITLNAPGPDPMPVTLSGNTGSVVAPAQTFTESGPIDLTVPTANTITPNVPSPSLELRGDPVKIVPGSGPRVFGAATAPDATSPLNNARYDFTITSVDPVPATDLAFTATTDDGGQLSPQLTGSTGNGTAITGTLPYPAGPTTLTFALAAGSTAATGILHVAVALDEYSTDNVLVNRIAAGTATVDDVVDGGPSYPTNATVFVHADGSSTPIDITATDPDSDNLTYTVLDAPAFGALSGTAPALAYTPDGAPRQDSFTYRVSDGFVTGPLARVTIQPNHAPSASQLLERVHNAGPTTFSLGPATDPADGQSLTYSVTTAPDNGQAHVAGTQATYTPAAGSPGADTFGYTVSDGVDSVNGTVSITVNAPPTLQPLQPRVRRDAPTTITVGPAEDEEGQQLSYSLATGDAPTFGALGTFVGNRVTYTPDANAPATDSFGIVADDGTDTATAVITVQINTVPVAAAQRLSTPFDRSVSVLLGPAKDEDGDPVTYARQRPAHGTLTGRGATLTYSPDAGFAGTDTFTYTAGDGRDTSAAASVRVSVAKAPSRITAALTPSHPTSAQRPVLTVHVVSPGRATGGTVVVATGSGTRTARVGSNGTAAVPLPRYPGGTQRVTATFRGTSTTSPSAPRTVQFTVTRVASSLTVTTNPLQLTTKTTNATATVRVRAGTLVADSGMVTIDENGRRLASGTVRSGSVTMHLPRFSLGQHNLTVGYAGTDAIAPSSVVKVERVSLGS